MHQIPNGDWVFDSYTEAIAYHKAKDIEDAKLKKEAEIRKFENLRKRKPFQFLEQKLLNNRGIIEYECPACGNKRAQIQARDQNEIAVICGRRDCKDSISYFSVNNKWIKTVPKLYYLQKRGIDADEFVDFLRKRNEKAPITQKRIGELIIKYKDEIRPRLKSQKAKKKG